MTQKKFTEKRKYLRFSMQTQIDFQVQQKGQKLSDSASAVTKNLSVEGVCFISDRKLEPSDMLKLEVYLSSQSQPLHLGGEVMWSIPITLPDGKEKYETGVKLFTIEKSDETRFLDYIYHKTMENVKKYP